MSVELGLGSATAEILLFLGACAILVAATFKSLSPRLLWYLTIALLLVVAQVAYSTWPEQGSATYNGLYSSTGLTAMLQVGILLASAAALAYSGDYLNERKILNGEFLSLALFATCGMLLLVAANHFLTLYLGLELMSLSLYSMIAMRRDNARAVESAMKYFVLGALASGLLLYGMSMVYAATGTLSIPEITASIASGTVSDVDEVLALGTVFIVSGVAFKLGAAPFHMWLPDVYDGAPTAVTLFIGTGRKIAAFAMAIRLVSETLAPLASDWSGMLALLAVVSLAVGNIAAIAQSSIKRMLAYSAISHMGFLLIGMVAATPEGYAAAMFYALAYALMSVGGFGMLVLLSRNGNETESLDDMKGMAKRNGTVAALMMILMLSMAGVPPLVGFYAKLVVWQAAVEAGWTWLAVVAGVFSVIGAFYYLRVIKLMYFDDPEEGASDVRMGTPLLVLACVNGLLVVIIGILPGSLMEACIQVFTGPLKNPKTPGVALDDLPDFTERRISGEVVHDAGFIRVERDRVLTPEGIETERHVVRHVGAVAVAAVTTDEKIVLVHQYRYAPGMHTLEVPAGKLDKQGEDPMECAKRELKEETGYVSDNWSWMLDTLSSPGFTDEMLKVYLALDATSVGPPEPEDDERVKPVPLPLSEAYRLMCEGKVIENRTQLSLLWLKDRKIPSEMAFEA